MSESLEKKKDLRDRIILYLRGNKRKILLSIVCVLLTIISIISFNVYKLNKNELISEKYIQAKLLLQNENKSEANKILEEIIFSKNKFYSILALNTILERNLIEDRVKIIEYFKLLEKMNIEEEQRDIIVLKKALYLIKHSDKEKGYEILKEISNSDSPIKFLAKEILDE